METCTANGGCYAILEGCTRSWCLPLRQCSLAQFCSASKNRWSEHRSKRRIWQHIHSPMESTQKRASRKEDSAIKDKYSRQFSDSTDMYWFCRQGGVRPVLYCQFQNSNDFNCFPMREGRNPYLLVYFMKVVSYAHVQRKQRKKQRKKVLDKQIGESSASREVNRITAGDRIGKPIFSSVEFLT